MTRRGRLFGAGLVALAALAARGPLHLATFELPVSNDDAVLLLMGEHILKGELATTLWNQPYNGALDAYLLAPGLAVAPHHAVFRVYEAACALLLVLLVAGLAHDLGGEGAGFWGALFAAFGTPYMALMACTGPPPNFLMPLVTGFPLLFALRGPKRGAAPPSPPMLAVVGFVCGLAIWNSSLAIPAFTGMAVGLWLSAVRPALGAGLFTAGLAVGASPLFLARVLGASGASLASAASAVTALRPPRLWASGLQDLLQALFGLLGLEVPLVVDGPERATLPLLARLALVVGLFVLLAAGTRARRALPLVLWAGALAGAFALSRRTGPDELRYLYGLNVPMLALAGAGARRLWVEARPAALGAVLAVLLGWGLGQRAELRAWREPAHSSKVWQVPPIDGAVAVLEAAQVRSAYASLQFAARLTLETGGRLVASQAFNERIPGDPLRFRDEVDLDPRAAWVLSPRWSRGMPRASGFRELLLGLGGSWREDESGELVVFHGFRPPYDESRPVPREALAISELGAGPLPRAVLDREPATGWSSRLGLRPGAGLVVRLAAPRPLDALVLAIALDPSPQSVPWVAQLGGEIVARGPARHGLQWINGAPRAARQALLVALLGGRRAEEVRLFFQGAGPPLALSEVFLYGPEEAKRPAAGAGAAAQALSAARGGRWAEAARFYAQAIRLEPERASFYSDLARARRRAGGRQWLDVESLGDGGPELVDVR